MDENFDTDTAARNDDRPRGVPKAKLGDINLEAKLALFYRPIAGHAMTLMDNSFPKEAAVIFCDRIRSDVQDNDSRYFVITGGEKWAYEKIFTWIRDCVQSQSIEKFPDIDEPEHDPFKPAIDIIAASERLGVPAGSLSFFVKKRLVSCARKNLMPFSQVREFYNVKSQAYQLGLKDVACASLFNAWWDARLDESVNPEQMEELYDMRQEIDELNEDLHKAFETRKEEVEKKWAEKDAKRAAEKAGSNSGVDSGSFETVQDSGITTGDWNESVETSSSTAVMTTGDWDTENVSVDKNNFNKWDQPQKIIEADDGWASATTQHENVEDWADEMNEPISQPTHFVPVPQW